MSELFLRLGFGFWSCILKETRDLMTFAYCLCSSDIKSKCKGKLTEGGMHHITVLVILEKSPLISDIELSLFFMLMEGNSTQRA